LEGRGGEGVQLSVSCVAPVQFDLETLSRPRVCAVEVKGRLCFTVVGVKQTLFAAPIVCLGSQETLVLHRGGDERCFEQLGTRGVGFWLACALRSGSKASHPGGSVGGGQRLSSFSKTQRGNVQRPKKMAKRAQVLSSFKGFFATG